MTSETKQDQAFAEDAEKSRQLATTLNAITKEQLQLTERIGAIKAFEFTKKLLTVSTIKMLAEVKESKIYKGLQVISDNEELLTVSTWDEFCNALGVSRQKVDLDIQHLSTFGEDFLETSQRMSLGYRDLRKLRKIPEDERELIINGEAVQAEDKDALVELIEDMSVKHAAEKTKLKDEIKDQKKQIKSLKDESEAKDRVLSDKNKLLDEKTTALELKLNAPAHERAKDYLTEIGVIEVEAVQVFGRLNALYQQIQDDQDEGEPVQPLCAPRMGHALMAIISQANDMLDFYQLGDINMGDDMSWVDEANAEIASRDASANDQ